MGKLQDRCTAKLGRKYKSSFKVYSETPFTKNSNDIETSQLQRFSNHLTGFYMIIVFIERYFRTDYNYIFFIECFYYR